MAAKGRVTRLESEIEKCRCHADWSKALDLARQVPSRSTSLETLVTLVQAESQLERYLLETPPNEANIAKAQQELPKPRQLLLDALKSDQAANLKEEIIMLIGKIDYAMGDYKGALAQFGKVDLNNIDLHKVSNRKLKIIAEAYATKGLCLEKIPPSTTSKFKAAEREEQIIECFEKGGDIMLAQLQDQQEKGSRLTNVVTMATTGTFMNASETETDQVGLMVETAIQRSPILYIRNRELSKGIGRFRELLRAVETRSTNNLRQTLARQLAEVLLRGVSPKSYSAIRLDPANDSGTTNDSMAHLKPKQYSAEKQYVPQGEGDEALLLLLISESMATKAAVLNRSPEFREAREHTFHNTTAVYDLLTLSLVRRAQFNMLSETFERAMKFSFDEFHIWYQFALSLICAEKYHRALLVLKECIRLNPKHPVAHIQAARLCYEHLHQIDDGIGLAQQATELEDNPMASRAYVALGVGYSLKAEDCRLLAARQDLQKQALHNFLRARSIDNNDHLALFHVAQQMALLRQIPEALMYVRKALKLRRDHLHSLHLLALLLSAQKQNEEALELTEAAVEEYPDNFSLLLTKCKLEELVYGWEEALHTCKHMLQLWKDTFEASLEDEQRGTGLIHKVTADHRSLVQLQLSELSDRDSAGSVRAESIAASRVEMTLSEVASSLTGSYVPKYGAQHTWNTQTQIWLTLAELYLRADKLEEAHACIQEAANIYPTSHMVAYTKGCLHEQKAEFADAKVCFENAASINPGHTKSLQHLGIVLHNIGNNRMAEKVLRDAVNADPTCSQSWHNLGKVLEALGDYQAAADCLLMSVDLETTSPAVPFTVIPRLVQ